jgi:hypothetical protein
MASFFDMNLASDDKFDTGEEEAPTVFDRRERIDS